MLTWIKWLFAVIAGLLIIVVAAGYLVLRASLPELEGESVSSQVSAPVSLSRDKLGQAIISAQNRNDAAFALGVAHGQDRLFQMDLQRRAAAGTLSEWVGSIAVEVDKRARFHQFSQRAADTFAALPDWQKTLLTHYADGVNSAIEEMPVSPPEYLLAGVDIVPWTPTDSLLVIYSMYMDLQSGQVAYDWARNAVLQQFGDAMLGFLTQPGSYQAALDGSEFDTGTAPTPAFPDNIGDDAFAYQRAEPVDIGSNNWAVTGAATDTSGAMLANDMHLGLRVPIIWYRAQLNYTLDASPVSVTGVSLPGLPGIVVGTNGHIAWGFTNANLDTVDWVKLSKNTTTRNITETIKLKDGEEPFTFEHSEYGPVRAYKGERYALSWVAHQRYAVNLGITRLDGIKNVDSALALAAGMGMPTQNMMVVDSSGNAAWTPAGAVPARPSPSNTAIDETAYNGAWSEAESDLPVVKNPASARLWTANARVISTSQVSRFGNGGYALGARAMQIRDNLFNQTQFDEKDFYDIQLDNRALFLAPWHELLVSTLGDRPDEYREELRHLNDWQACACADSVGYTLVRRFRSAVSDLLVGPVLQHLESQNVNTGPLLRGVEPALWQLLRQQPQDWLANRYANYDELLIDAYQQTRDSLLARYDRGNGLEDVTWGRVNALNVTHPFAAQIPVLGDTLNMPSHPGFGDSYMPAVQAPSFGASQRLFVRPGALDKAILTLPGGQSGHPLSPYFRRGFDDYVNHAPTPLLPQRIEVSRHWRPSP